MAKNNYQDWSKTDLIKEIERLKKRKKYGLVWEEKPEEVVEMKNKGDGSLRNIINQNTPNKKSLFASKIPQSRRECKRIT